jgi:hypothetical protein
MPLQKQVIAFPLGTGIDTKTDPKQVQPGKLLVAENEVYNSIGQLVPRFGLTAYSSSILGGGTLSSATKAAAHKQELLVFGGNKLYGVRPTAAAPLTDKGSVYSATVQSRGIAAGLGDQLHPTVAYGDDLIACSYLVYNGTTTKYDLYCTILDRATQEPVVANRLILADVIEQRCVYFSGSFYFFLRVSPSVLYSVRVQTSAATTFGGFTLVANDIDSDPVISFSLSQSGNYLALLYAKSTNGAKLGFITAAGSIGGPSDGLPTAVSLGANVWGSTDYVHAHAYLVGDATNDGVYAFLDSTCYIYNASLSNSPSGIASITMPAVTDFNSRLATVNESASTIRIFADGRQTAVSDEQYNIMRTCTLTRSGVASASSTVVRSLSIASQPFRQGGDTYVLAAFTSSLQSSYFLLHSSGKVVARCSYQKGGGSVAHLSDVVSDTAGQYLIPNVVRGRLYTNGVGAATFQKTVQLSRFTFGGSGDLNPVALGNTTYFSGGCPRMYDGAAAVELGFHYYPENLTATGNASATSMLAGTYQVAAIFEWVDLNGQIHRSAPSVPASATLTAGQKLDVIVPTLRLTDRSLVKVVLYVTEANGTTFYRAFPFDQEKASSTALDSVTYSITGVSTTREILYTTGGVLENIAPPSCAQLLAYGNRLVAVGLEDEDEIWYSKLLVNGDGLGFNDTFTLRVPEGKRGVCSAVVIDEKLIFFKRQGASWIAGQGPTDTGINSDLGNPQPIPSDVGCDDPRSVVNFPGGAFFKSSDRGWCMIDRALNVSYKGGVDVDRFNSLSVSSAILIPKSSQIRITHSDGQALVFDFFYGQWSTFTNYECVSACLWGSTYVMVRSTGQINRESTSSWLDNGAEVVQRVVTPWYSLAGLQGFQRVWRAAFLGENRSAHTYKVRVRFDFDPEWKELFTVASSSIGADYVTDASYYTASDNLGGTPKPVHQLEVNPYIQKCQAIAFEISSSNPTLVDGEGFRAAAIALVVGVKPGTKRLTAGQKMASA